MSKPLVLPAGYKPRSQFIPFHASRKRWRSIVAHRRCGKTVACVADLVDSAFRPHPYPDPRYAYLAPTYGQAKDVAWGYLKRMAAIGEAPVFEEREGELSITCKSNGAKVRLYGVENYDRLRGLPLSGVVLDEFGDFDPRAWPEVIRPALADRNGWAVFIGTPKGRNAFFEIHERAKRDAEWLALTLRASETGILPQRELEDIRATLSPEQYEAEMECSFDAAIVGAYYASALTQAEEEGRISEEVEADPALPVHTAWDLGVGDSTAIWFFQMAGAELRVLDYYEASGYGLEHYAEVIHAKPYPMGNAYVPHDARVKELGTGRTRVETLKRLGLTPHVVAGHKLMDGINAARLTLPRCWFNRARTAKGVDALRMYRSEYDAKEKVFRDTPKHDWTSHCADAFRYMALAWREVAVVAPKPVIDLANIPTPTIDQLLAEHDRQRMREEWA